MSTSQSRQLAPSPTFIFSGVTARTQKAEPCCITSAGSYPTGILLNVWKSPPLFPGHSLLVQAATPPRAMKEAVIQLLNSSGSALPGARLSAFSLGSQRLNVTTKSPELLVPPPRPSCKKQNAGGQKTDQLVAMHASQRTEHRTCNPWWRFVSLLLVILSTL